MNNGQNVDSLQQLFFFFSSASPARFSTIQTVIFQGTLFFLPLNPDGRLTVLFTDSPEITTSSWGLDRIKDRHWLPVSSARSSTGCARNLQSMDSSTKPRSSRFRVMFSLVMILLACTGGVTAFAFLASLRPPTIVREPEVRQFRVDLFEVQPARLQEMVSSLGSAQADKEVVLAAQVAGEILQTHPQLKIGTSVQAPDVTTSGTGESLFNAGDTLVTIDPRPYEERVIQVESRIAEARAELALLEQQDKNLERLDAQLSKDLDDLQQEVAKVVDLTERKIATDSDLRRARMELRSSETQLIQNENDRALMPSRREQIIRRIATLQNDLEVAKLDRSRTIIRPPFRGRLTKVFAEQGQYVKVGDPLVTLTDSARVEIPLAVSLTDYARLMIGIQAGQRAQVSLAENESAPARWHGELVRTSPVADEKTRTVMVYVEVENREQDTPLLPGTFVHARIDGPVLDNVIAIPRDAVLGGRVYVLKDGKAHRRQVEIDHSVQGMAIVSKGLQAGERVIRSNLDALYEGAPVLEESVQTLASELATQPAPLIRVLNTAGMSAIPPERSAAQP